MFLISISIKETVYWEFKDLGENMMDLRSLWIPKYGRYLPAPTFIRNRWGLPHGSIARSRWGLPNRSIAHCCQPVLCCCVNGSVRSAVTCTFSRHLTLHSVRTWETCDIKKYKFTKYHLLIVGHSQFSKRMKDKAKCWKMTLRLTFRRPGYLVKAKNKPLVFSFKKCDYDMLTKSETKWSSKE